MEWRAGAEQCDRIRLTSDRVSGVDRCGAGGSLGATVKCGARAARGVGRALPEANLDGNEWRAVRARIALNRRSDHSALGREGLGDGFAAAASSHSPTVSSNWTLTNGTPAAEAVYSSAGQSPPLAV